MSSSPLDSFLQYIPRNLPILFSLASRYIDISNNDNNCNFFTNGEAFFLRRFAADTFKQHPTIFDIGANIGDWSNFLLSLHPSANIHLFEPSHATFETLSTRDWPSNVTLNNFGLGSQNQSLLLNVQGSAGTNSLIDRSEILGPMQKELVNITSLDNYCESHAITQIDLIKIDVEGFELSVLQGAQRMLNNGAISILQFEYGGTFLDARIQLKDIWLLLTSAGYRLAKVFPRSLKYIENYTQVLESYKYSNWVAIYDG